MWLAEKASDLGGSVPSRLGFFMATNPAVATMFFMEYNDRRNSKFDVHADRQIFQSYFERCISYHKVYVLKMVDTAPDFKSLMYTP